MRSDPRDYELAAPASLAAAVSLMASDPGRWVPIAGGTDLMVLYAAGKLPARRLVSIWNLPELRRIEVLPDEVRIGAASTYGDLLGNQVILAEFPLLANAAALTGGVANQNRGTIGGNIANASPAGDSLPALLAYEAQLVLVSARGEREVPYVAFHRGYKTHALEAGELIRAIRLPRRFSGYVSFYRKVGTRRAQAIAKVGVAALGKLSAGSIEDVRIAVASVAPFPVRLPATEQLLLGKRAEPSLAGAARETVAKQIQPIDDIRSAASYRTAVAANLVADFVESLCAEAAGA
jgi:CO/xanthine dehydrogenase FAD-binding subunit